MKFLSDSFRWMQDLSGKWLCIAHGHPEETLAEIDAGKLYDIEIKKHRDKRSLDANAYAWVLMDKLAAALTVSKEKPYSKAEVYRLMIKSIPGVSEIVCVQDKAVEKLVNGWEHNGLGWLAETIPSKIDGCTNVVLYYGSSCYDTKQMSRLIDAIIAECKQFGIETMTPEELKRLEGYDC